jgi:hypothetical protein
MFRVKTSAANARYEMPCVPDDGMQGFVFREKDNPTIKSLRIGDVSVAHIRRVRATCS